MSLQAFDGWGQFLQKQYGEKDWYTWEDSTIIFLGYWSDNGAGCLYSPDSMNAVFDESVRTFIFLQGDTITLIRNQTKHTSRRWWISLTMRSTLWEYLLGIHYTVNIIATDTIIINCCL